MFTLKGRQDGFRLLLPNEFIPKHVEEKYAKIIQEGRSFIVKPIDFLNETIQKVQVLGFNNASVNQVQPRRGDAPAGTNRIQQNRFMYAGTDTTYRSPANPESLLDKTMNVTFKHTLGYLNYFILFESFLYFYSRDVKSSELPKLFQVELLNNKGSVYARLNIKDPIIDGIDMLDFDFTQPIAQSQTFNVIFKYSDFEYEFVQAESSNWNGEVE